MVDGAAADVASYYDFDVAVSFAGEDREYVEGFVRRLQSIGVKVFYDQDHLAAMWGENLIDFLEAVYTHRARYAILFVSHHYVQKKWTDYERRSVQDRALQQAVPYLLPIRLDDTKLPGLPSTVLYLDSRSTAVDAIVDAVAQKLGQSRAPSRNLFNGRTPRTPEEMSLLLQERPFGWEMLLYAAVVHRGMNALAGKYEDHVIGYARSNGAYLDDKQVVKMIRGQLTAMGVALLE